MDGNLLVALALIPAIVIAIVFHEVAHGWTALALGDPTAKERNRLSLNPIRHVDPIGTIGLPLLLAVTGAPVFGWAKPVPVIKQRLRNPRFGMMAVAAAGRRNRRGCRGRFLCISDSRFPRSARLTHAW